MVLARNVTIQLTLRAYEVIEKIEKKEENNEFRRIIANAGAKLLTREYPRPERETDAIRELMNLKTEKYLHDRS